MKLAYRPEDFKTYEKFVTATKKQVGETAYVGPDYMCLCLGYPEELKKMIRPYPEKTALEFEIFINQIEVDEAKNNYLGLRKLVNKMGNIKPDSELYKLFMGLGRALGVEK